MVYKPFLLELHTVLIELSQNRAFVDGNKRVAFATTAIFVCMNGYRLKVDPDDGESFLIDDVIQKKASVEHIAAWLEKHMRPA